MIGPRHSFTAPVRAAVVYASFVGPATLTVNVLEPVLALKLPSPACR